MTDNLVQKGIPPPHTNSIEPQKKYLLRERQFGGPAVLLLRHHTSTDTVLGTERMLPELYET
jgi:hypothetical protein